MRRAALTVATGLALMGASILGAGHLADIVPTAVFVVGLIVLGVMAFIGLAVAP